MFLARASLREQVPRVRNADVPASAFRLLVESSSRDRETRRAMQKGRFDSRQNGLLF